MRLFDQSDPPQAPWSEGLLVTMSLSVKLIKLSQVHTASSVWHLLHILILSFDFSTLYLVAPATPELKDFLTQARGGDVRIVKIVIRNGKGSVRVGRVLKAGQS